MLTNDLNISVSRPHTGSGVPENSNPPPVVDGALKLENDQDFLITEDGAAYLAFEIGS